MDEQLDMDMIKNLSIEDFCGLLSTSSPVPGGGSVSAYVASLGTALAGMVANLTSGKKKYAEYQEEIEDIIKTADVIREDLMDGISRDAESFLPLAGAYSLPSETEEEKKYKEETLEELLVVAASAPLELIRKIIPAMEILERLTEIGTKLAVSDIGTGLLLCDAAATSAALNVYCNTKLMKNRSVADKMNEEADELIKRSFQIRANNLPKVIVSLRTDENV
ncbi:cyclodeaminase/cyclohydrolase family protein [Howardella ureilytica]|nr:cyclodeaminase/cyclohydrolase family protein [Lachnospiraceae bacterium]MDY2956698.1 cyclodeaminase/cyclohydrolase family protein [Lachnospiraceae bacterium]